MKELFLNYMRPIGVGAAVILLGGTGWYIYANRAPSFSGVAVARGTVVSSVREEGTVRAEASADLSFEEAGQIVRVNVKEGDVVAAGAPLASLDASGFEAAREGADAALAAAQARLDALTAGTRPEELAIAESSAGSAQAALTAAIGSAYTAADDAVKNQTDNFFSNPQSNNPIFFIPTKDSQTQIDIEDERVKIGVALAGWYNALRTVTDPGALSKTADAAAAQVKSYLDTVALAVNDALPGSSVTAATLAGYKVNMGTARTEVATSLTALTSAEAAYAAARDKLTLAKAGATPQEIEAQQALVLQAKAADTSAKVALDRATLVAPFSGTVQNLTAKVGQVVAPGVPMLSLVNQNGLKIDVFVSQADIANVRQGERADVTLDAYGTSTVFPATVTTVGAGQTQVNGSPAYKVTLHFANPDSRVKDGMSANVHIVIAEHPNVLMVPTRLIVSDSGHSYVIVSDGTGGTRREVAVGVAGDGGMTEIVSGLSEGDKIVEF